MAESLSTHMTPNGLELSCPAEAGRHSVILAHAGGPGAPTYPLARQVGSSELLGGTKVGLGLYPAAEASCD